MLLSLIIVDKILNFSTYEKWEALKSTEIFLSLI